MTNLNVNEKFHAVRRIMVNRESDEKKMLSEEEACVPEYRAPINKERW